jgi:hypothetical protein
MRAATWQGPLEVHCSPIHVFGVQHYMTRRYSTMFEHEQWQRSPQTESQELKISKTESFSC